MSSEARKSPRVIGADIFALDRDDRPLLVAEVKARRGTTEEGVLQFLAYFAASDFPFGMFADLNEIAIFGKDLANPRSPICSLKATDILSYYEPEFTTKRIYPEYFETLIEAWLRDFAFHWKSERPPGADQLETIGLAQRLAGGMTHQSEEAYADPPLY